jgi:hypothetical protein
MVADDVDDIPGREEGLVDGQVDAAVQRMDVDGCRAFCKQPETSNGQLQSACVVGTSDFDKIS